MSVKAKVLTNREGGNCSLVWIWILGVFLRERFGLGGFNWVVWRWWWGGVKVLVMCEFGFVSSIVLWWARWILREKFRMVLLYREITEARGLEMRKATEEDNVIRRSWSAGIWSNLKTEENCGQVIEIFITRLKVCAPDKCLALYSGSKITPKVINPGSWFWCRGKGGTHKQRPSQVQRNHIEIGWTV